jgi:uncharacterized membrane protein (DUF485 family)
MRASLLTFHHVPAGYRILYTGVSLLLALGYGVGLLEQHWRGGLSPRSIAEWYRGNEVDPAPDELLFPREASEILDETWNRAMADAVPAVILLALLFRAGSASAARRGLEAAIVAFAFADMTGPALVRWGGAWLAWPVAVARWGLFGSAVAVTALVLREVWLRRAAGPRFESAAEAGQ